jgi:type II secretory pathway component GspD/PulD (secretin)
LFSSSTYGNNNNNNQGFRMPIQFAGRFGGGFGGNFGGGNRGGGNNNTGSGTDSSRMQKQTQVVAVPDLRTGSVIVSASRDLMKQIEGMVRELDADPAKKQQVYVFDFQNTDPNQAVQILQTLFPNQQNGMNNMRNMNGNQAGTGNQLNNRATQNQNTYSRAGSSSGGFGGGSMGGGLGGSTLGR